MWYSAPVAYRKREVAVFGYAEEVLAGLPETTLQKVLHDTPARLYGLE